MQNKASRIVIKYVTILGVTLFLCSCSNSTAILETPVSSNKAVSRWMVNYENGAPYAVVHFDENKNYIGTFYYPDGTPLDISHGILEEASDGGIIIKSGTSMKFYPDGTPIPQSIFDKKKFSYYEVGKLRFDENGRTFILRFDAKKLGPEHIVSIYIYPISENSEIANRFIIKTKTSDGTKWDVKSYKLFDYHDVTAKVDSSNRNLLVNVRSGKDKKEIFSFSFGLIDFLKDLKKDK